MLTKQNQLTNAKPWHTKSVLVTELWFDNNALASWIHVIDAIFITQLLICSICTVTSLSIWLSDTKNSTRRSEFYYINGRAACTSTTPYTPVLQLYCGCRIILSRGVRLKKKKKKKYYGEEVIWAFHVAFLSLGFYMTLFSPLFYGKW